MLTKNDCKFCEPHFQSTSIVHEHFFPFVGRIERDQNAPNVLHGTSHKGTTISPINHSSPSLPLSDTSSSSTAHHHRPPLPIGSGKLTVLPARGPRSNDGGGYCCYYGLYCAPPPWSGLGSYRTLHSMDVELSTTVLCATPSPISQ